MRFLPVAAATLLLAGFAGNHALGADTKVSVTFEYTARTGVNARRTALASARDQCRAKGYQDAAEFGAPKLACLQAGQGSSCLRTSATEAYRCSGMSNN